MIRSSRTIAMLATSAALLGGTAVTAIAQTPAQDPSARLREVLPADVAERVLAKIATARARELPAQALEHRALKFAAKGVAPKDIEQSVAEQADRMAKVKDVLEKARGRKASGEEVEAGAEVLRRGVDGAAVGDLAKSAPSGRSLAVPLFVIGSLMDRGLPSDEALARVNEKLLARAADREIEEIGTEVSSKAKGLSNKPAVTGQDLANTKRPAGTGAGARPTSVPANAGKGAKPPTIPPKKGPGGV